MNKQLFEKLARILVICFFWLAIGLSLYLGKYSNLPQGVLLLCWVGGLIPYLIYIRTVRQWRGPEQLDYSKKGVKPLNEP